MEEGDAQQCHREEDEFHGGTELDQAGLVAAFGGEQETG